MLKSESSLELEIESDGARNRVRWSQSLAVKMAATDKTVSGLKIYLS